MAVKTKPEGKKSVGFTLKVRTAGKILEETILHPGKTSRIVADPEKDTVTVTRNDNSRS